MRKYFPLSNLPIPEPQSAGSFLRRPASRNSSDQSHNIAPALRCSTFYTCIRVESSALRLLPRLSKSSGYAAVNDGKLLLPEYRYLSHGYNGFQASPILPGHLNRGNSERVYSGNEPPGS